MSDTAALPPTPVQQRKPRRWRLRFSLQSLLLLFMMGGAGSAVYVHWEPWSWLKDLPIQNAGTLSFSPDSRLLASTAFFTARSSEPEPEQLAAKLWDIHNGTCLSTLSGNTAELTSAVFSPDGSQVATASCDGAVKLWPLNGKSSTTLCENIVRQNSVAYSPDGLMLATAGRDGFHIFNAAKHEEIAFFRGIGRQSAGFSADGKRVTAVDEWGPGYSWTVGSQTAPQPLPLANGISAHTDGEFILRNTMHGMSFSSAADPKKVVWLDAQYSRHFAVSPDRRIFVVAKTGSAVEIRSTATGQCLYTLSEHADILSIAFAPDATLAFGTSKGVRLFRRNHPEYWWGVLSLPELWVTFAFAVLFLWSIIRKASPPAQQQAGQAAAEHQPA